MKIEDYLNENPLDENEEFFFRKGAEISKEQTAREVIESIFDYENESNYKIIDFDRTVEDVLKIYLEKE